MERERPTRVERPNKEHILKRGDFVRYNYSGGGSVRFDDGSKQKLHGGETAFVIADATFGTRLLHIAEGKQSSNWSNPSRAWEKVDA